MTKGSHPTAPNDPVQLFQLVMDNIPQFIFWKDLDSVYLGCNQNFADAAGVASPADIVGKTDYDLAWKEEEAHFFREVDSRVMASDAAELGIVEPQLQASGREAWLRTNKIPLHDAQGLVVGILGTFEDITDEKLAEDLRRQRQKLESIGQLAGGVAHDFNNLLTAILNAAQLIERSPDDASQRRTMIDVILAAGGRAANLTSKLLAFSRQGQLERQPTDVHELISDVVAILERSIDRRIRIELELCAENSTVVGDSSELAAMILNLGINARDAISGAGTISISTKVQMVTEEDSEKSPFAIEPGRFLSVSLRDTGGGIDEAVVHRIFDPFFTTKSPGAGTGLGLAASYGTVTEHGGAIYVESPQGEGACFTILLPLSRAKVAGRDDLEGPAMRGEGTILVIEDEGGVR